ncbi:MAG TPA: chromate transporter [Prolixibacteraceae bacterium]
MREVRKISSIYLFFTFLKIGAISWGGFMALIAVMKKQLVDKDKILKEEVVLDGISLASVLPGAVAINVATYLGYHLRGTKGALICLTATILPAFFAIIGLGTIYSTYGELPLFNKFFLGVLPAISAIILSVAFGMAQKQVKDYKQLIICALAGVGLLTIHSFIVTLAVIISSALLGYFLYRNPGSKVKSSETKTSNIGINKQPGNNAISDTTSLSDENALSENNTQPGNNTLRRDNAFSVNKMILDNNELLNKQTLFNYLIGGILLVLIIALIINYFDIYDSAIYKINRTIFLTFTGMSLTLFGGGYVIVPAMQSVIVDGFHWLTTKEFADAIAMGQITPGPVIITVTFIGYRVAGYLGAFFATLAIFYPPGFLMIILSGFLRRIKDSDVINAVFRGMRPAIIGMIFSAAITVGKGAEMLWPSALIFTVVLILLMKYKLNVIYMIPLAGIVGMLLF